MSLYYVDTAVGSDSNAGTSPGAGNAFATLAKGLSVLGAGDICYAKASGTYSTSTALNFPAAATYTSLTRLIGYTASPGDGGKATIQATAGISIFAITQTGCSVENFIIDGNSVASTLGVDWGNAFGQIVNCEVKRCAGIGIWAHSGDLAIKSCDVHDNGGFGIRVDNTFVAVTDSKIHSNAYGIDATTGGPTITNCQIYRNTDFGGRSTYRAMWKNNTFHANGAQGLQLQNNYIAIHYLIQNNIFSENGTYGLELQTAPVTSFSNVICNNAFFNNTTANRNNISAGPGDVTLTGSPFTNAAGDDYTLNNTAGAGASCRAAGSPANTDIGALQHVDAGGGGGGSPTPSNVGIRTGGRL